jgi:CBS domain-containing protein
MTLQRIIVRDFMVRRVVTISPETEILQALQILITKDIAGAPVVSASGSIVGIITEKDCMRVALNATYHSEYGGVVADFMASPVVTISPDDSIVDVLKQFLRERYHRYPVVEDDRLVGLVSRRDVLRALGKVWH